jgi:UDP-glucose 4-epimerase
MFEQMLHDLAKAEPQFSIIAFRNFNPVGAHESGLIGEEPNGILDKLLLYIA